jgi:D-alanyl-D-alanine carboxypeptidase (penicillin-binding protein 5/6)
MFVLQQIVHTAKKIAFWIALSCFVFIHQIAYAVDLVIIDPQSIKAESWLIMDGDSGQTLAQFNAMQQRAPASLTKMMLAYVSLKQISAGKLHGDDILTVPIEVNQIASDESRMNVQAGEQLTVTALLTGLIVTSANDAAVTLATHIAGNVPAFVRMMNDEAQQLGLNGTHFANVSGISQDGHYTTAYDMAKLSRAIIQQCPEYTHFSKMQHFSHGAFSEAATNHLLKRDPSVDGMKTGYTKAAGYNLVATAHRHQAGLSQDRRVFVVVMGSASKYARTEDAAILLNNAYLQTQNIQLLRHNQPIAKIRIWQAEQSETDVLAPQDVFITVPNPNSNSVSDNETLEQPSSQPVAKIQAVAMQQPSTTQIGNINYQLNFASAPMIAPLSQQQHIGQLVIEYNGKHISKLDLNPSHDIQPAGFFERQWDKVKLFFYQLFNISFQPIDLL